MGLGDPLGGAELAQDTIDEIEAGRIAGDHINQRRPTPLPFCITGLCPRSVRDYGPSYHWPARGAFDHRQTGNYIR